MALQLQSAQLRT